MPNSAFGRPDMRAFIRLDGQGVEGRGQRMWPDLACWLAGSLVRTGGVDAVDVRVRRVTR